MEIEKIEGIIKILKKYDLHRIYIENNTFKLEIEDQPKNNSRYETLDCADEKDISNKLSIISDNEHLIRSPLVGTVEVAENKSTFKKYVVGDKVKVGQCICIIEAMKMFNEITSDVDGTIIEVLVKDKQFVEFDQPLFKIRKKGENDV